MDERTLRALGVSTMELEEKKNKTILSKIAVAVVVIYYLLGITALAAQQYGLKLYEQGNSEMARFFYNKVWDSLAPFVVMIPLLAAIPNVILNIVGIIKEKRVFPFLLCIFAPIVIWFVVAAVATAYF